MTNLIQQFAASQTQSQLGLASQAFGLNSGSKASPYLSGSTADCEHGVSCLLPALVAHVYQNQQILDVQQVHWALCSTS